MAWAAVTGPMPVRSSRPGARAVTRRGELLLVAGELAGRRRGWRGRGAGPRRGGLLFAVVVCGHGGGAIAVSRAAVSVPRHSVPVGVVAGEQQRAEPVDLPGLGRWSARAGRPAGSAGLRGPRRRAARQLVERPCRSACSAARRASIGSDLPRLRDRPGGAVRPPPRSARRRPAPARARCRSCGCPPAPTTTRGPGALSPIQASASAKPAASLLMRTVAEGRPRGRDHLQRVTVAVRVTPDDGVDVVCQHGHAASVSFQACGRSNGTGLGGVTERHICDGSRTAGADRLLIRPTVGQAGAGVRGDKSFTSTPRRPDHA